ncbi:putative inactive serine/threonine-protein kinase lvsG [Dorcoceras hygrometricum]|uniref:Putative inactive serine/threonine-protein kinase lvsG n=1 Tax=Dorcoceras hygrometricum TaxID=472368 RepID=A0A2Z7BL21_9LAMI|nr:putative inactive serine/threonine-protein kinase lvsG [Dorcoceras hygrometricum]
MGRETEMCFDCLQRRIEADYSGELSFIYGLSDSPLPLGSSAVIQMSDSGESAAYRQFVLSYTPYCEEDCLSKYIDESSSHEDGYNTAGENIMHSNLERDQVEASVGIPSGRSHSSDATAQCPSSSNRDRNIFVNGLRCEKCISSKFSCSRTLYSLAPTARIGKASSAFSEDLASDFLSGAIEDHILHSINLLIDGKSAVQESINFLSLIGIPSFQDNGFPGCIRHPNIAPILGILKSSSHINVVLQKMPFTLENIMHYSPEAITSDWHVIFLIYQVLSALAYMHGLGIAHGKLCPSNVILNDTGWCWLPIAGNHLLNSKVNLHGECYNFSARGFCFEGCSSSTLYADLSLSESVDWHSSFHRWWQGELSNFEYLLILNRLAGRRWGDHMFHTVMPWVVDFTVKPDENSDVGWRDLSKSKWRLAKGDEQLDFTYSTSEIPHHVSDECLSELAVCSYKARRLPLSVLRTAVRSVYEPNEYPSNMQRLYQWTPDECIPEFYCDPRIFYSLHSGMPDLAVPSWAGSPEEFIKLHRDALENTCVSRQIHNWIDITFGFKMRGAAAIDAKNVMLPTSISTKPRSVGRRQLFTQPHPPRQKVAGKLCGKKNGYTKTKNIGCVDTLSAETNNLQKLEDAALFSEKSSHLCPCYNDHLKDSLKDGFSGKELTDSIDNILSNQPDWVNNFGARTNVDLSYLLENLEVDDDSSTGFQELFLWSQTFTSKVSSKGAADDMFAIGCILAELQLKKPLFGLKSLDLYMESGVVPSTMQELPYHVRLIVETCIQKDWSRRPSAKCILESPYFPKSVKSSYIFLASFHLLANDACRLQYAATFAKHGALEAMGAFGVEMCAPYCLPLLVTSTSDTEAEWAYMLLSEFLKCLNSEAIMKLVVPSIQSILQASWLFTLKGFSSSRFIHTRIMEPNRSSAAATVLLTGSSEELGVPITVHQTILSLILCFGKGICNDGIDALVRIGGLFGENFIVKQLVPLLKSVVHSCTDTSYANKSEPMQSWASLALVDCLTTLDGIVPSLANEIIIKELIEDRSCMHVKILMRRDLENRVFQTSARSLIRICQQIGADLTALHVLPKLRELFSELAFSNENDNYVWDGNLKGQRLKLGEEDGIESRMDLVLILYPPLASILGIEKLRQCCATWLLLEQFLLRHHNWKWEYTGDPSQSDLEGKIGRRSSYNKNSSSNNMPTKHLLNGVGWSIPQSQGKMGPQNTVPVKYLSEHYQNPVEWHGLSSASEVQEPWFWFPSAASTWSVLDFTTRTGFPKDELPWKIRASIIQSTRAHNGAVRSFAVGHNECTVFTAGVGPGFRGNIQRWELSTVDCVMSYNRHEEVVNDIRILASSGRVASCDGTVHIWNGQTGKLIFAFSESSLVSTRRMDRDEDNMLHFNTSPSGMISNVFHGSLYTKIDYLEFIDRLVVGTGNGSLRFFDVNCGQKLHLWRGEPTDSSFSPLISSICSSGSAKLHPEDNVAYPSWIAASFSTGYCSLFDMRCGNIISSWQAHDGYVTKLAAASDHLLVSSSLDKTLRIWDLRRNWASEHTVFKGYGDSVSGFAVWGQNVISICKNKIGLCSLTSTGDEDGQFGVIPQNLFMADGESKNLSMLSAITILPFSRLFLVGTEDGHFKICC